MDVSPKIALLPAVLLALGCSTAPEELAYRRLANRMNPVLLAIKPAATRVMAARDPIDLINACTSVDGALRSLGRLEMEDEYTAIRDRGVRVHDWARGLTVERHLGCRSHPDVEWGTPRCVEWCREHWNGLAETVDRLAAGAAAHDIGIVPLR